MNETAVPPAEWLGVALDVFPRNREMLDFTRQFRANLTAVGDRIAAAAERSGRSPTDVTLIAVTKYVDPDMTAAITKLGCSVLGESRPQDLWRKVEVVANPNVQWHLIGHLQRNKVRRTIPLVKLIHSVDSLRLMQEIDVESRSLSQITPILLEVNISGDETKHGFQPDAMSEAVQVGKQLANVQIRGLMGMASREGDLLSARQEFRSLRKLRDELSRDFDLNLPDLSMGMSGDFEVAVEEGATLVRIGSVLFEGVLE